MTTVRTMQAFTFETRGDVHIVTLRHPTSAMNAVDELLHHEFGELFGRLRRDPGGRVVVLTAEGRAFSAGGDFAWFPQLRDTAVLDDLRRVAKQMIWDLLDIEVPVVCGLNGSAAGLGASIALLCDLIVMSDRAVVLDPHVNVGLVAGDGGTVIWPQLLGPMAAKRHLFLGDPLSAADALRLGVAAEVCAPELVRERALAWADRLATQPPLAMKGTKMAVNAGLKQALLTSFDLATALEIPCFLSRDHAEAVDALRERRTPTYEGR